MLNSGKKIRVLRDKKKILTLVLSEKKILNETKNLNPPFKLNGRSLRGNDGLIYSDSNNKADILNTQFKSAYTQEESSLPDLGQSSTPSMPDISISFKGVHKLLS